MRGIKELLELKEELETSMDAFLQADETLHDVEDKMEDIKELEHSIINTVEDVEQLIDKKVEMIKLKMFIIEMKVYGAIFLFSIIGTYWFWQENHPELAIISLAFAMLVSGSSIVTLYRYLKHDFIADTIEDFILLIDPRVPDPLEELKERKREKLEERFDVNQSSSEDL